jgi:hypothetical protein
MTRGKSNRDCSGANNGNARLSAQDVAEIRAIRFGLGRLPRSHPHSINALAARFGVSKGHLWRICRQKRWKTP